MIAIIDVYSRKILNWSISNTMNVEWCAQVYQDTLDEFGCPEILNTDQGSQFTIPIFTKFRLKTGSKNPWTVKEEHLITSTSSVWRALKDEHIYLNPANVGEDLYEGVRKYVQFYNQNRKHTSIENKTPDECVSKISILKISNNRSLF